MAPAAQRDSQTGQFKRKAPTGVEVVDRRSDATRDALQRAAMRDHRARTEPGWTRLPNGEVVRIQGAAGMGYPGEKATDMLARPADMLLNPLPDWRSGPRYQWRVRTSPKPEDTRPAETQNLHRAERIRYIETSEIDPACEFAIYTEFATPNNKYVTYQTLILCEIQDELLAYQTYKGWDDYALSKIENLEETVRGSKDEYGGTVVSNKTDMTLEVGPPRQGG